MNIGTEFELDIEKEFGLRRVPGSGSGWKHKLDVQGRGTRWSLKATEKEGFRVDGEMLREAIRETEGVGGTREIPIWAVRIIGLDDFVIMRKEDWKNMMTSEPIEIPVSKSRERRLRSKIPQLLRRDDV